jgi:hypothetical protein
MLVIVRGVIVGVLRARTGLVGTLSTTGLAVVATAGRTVLELDGLVLRVQRHLLDEREVGPAPVVEEVTGMWS